MPLLLLLLLLFPATSLAETSQIMPRAEQSLLLDGQVIGDRIIVVGERGHILISEDNGQTWRQQETPTRATLTSVYFVDPANGWAAGHDSVILQTRDGGRHWQKIYADPDDERPILDLWFRDQLNGYATGAYGLFLMTDDGGISWTEVELKPATLVLDESPLSDSWDEAEEDSWGIDFHLNQIIATADGRFYIVAEAGNLYRSDDGCRSWLSLPSPYEGSFYGGLPLEQNDLLLFGLRGHLFHTDDAGKSWSEIETNTHATLNDGIRLRDGQIVLAGLAGTLLFSEDSARTFQLRQLNSRVGIARILQADDDALIIIGEAGVKRLDPSHDLKEAGK